MSWTIPNLTGNGSIDSVRGYVLPKWYCPESARGITNVGARNADGELVFPIQYSYGMNVQGVDCGLRALDKTNAPYADVTVDPWAAHAYNNGKCSRPAERLLFADAGYDLINEYGVLKSGGWGGKDGNYDDMGDISQNASVMVNGTSVACSPFRSVIWRHNGMANVCFFDGHVSLLRKDELYSDVNATLPNDTLWNPMSLQ
jgi:prepilin-type processing-associated H-X9-DG protein